MWRSGLSRRVSESTDNFKKRRKEEKKRDTIPLEVYYELFWLESKEPMVKFFNKSLRKGDMSASQKQAAISYAMAWHIL